MLFGITMVKNEEATIGHVVEHLLAEGLDHVIVANNLSSDGTQRVLDTLVARGLPLTVVQDDELAYMQGVKMTRLANLARELGATWIVPFDADELWVAVEPGRTLRDVLLASDDADVLVCEWYDHVPTLLPDLGRNCFQRMRRRDATPSQFDKVAFRALPGVTISQGNHFVLGRNDLREARGRVVVHHYRWRSIGHFIRKNRNGRTVMVAGGDALDSGWSREWRKYGRRTSLHLGLNYLNLIRFQRSRGTVLDPVLPSRTATSPR